MGWATAAIERLKLGEVVQLRPRGHSMRGKVESGQLVTVSPDKDALAAGDIVLCKVKGQQYLHLIKAINSQGRYLIGNNRGGTNGWIGLDQIFGRAIKVE